MHISRAEESPIMNVGALPDLKRVGVTPHSRVLGCAERLPPEENRKTGRKTRNPRGRSLNQATNVSITAISHADSVSPEVMGQDS